MKWRSTATQIRGYARALRESGTWEGVLRHCSPAVVAALERPLDGLDARATCDLYAAIEASVGGAGLEQLTERMMFQTIGRVVAPVVNVTLALLGAKPATVLSRFGIGLPQAMEGVSSSWEPGPERSGSIVLDFHTTAPLPPTLEHVFRGAIRYVASLATEQVTIHEWQLVRPGVVRFPLTWTNES